MAITVLPSRTVEEYLDVRLGKMIYARKARKTSIKHSNEPNTHIYH